MGKFSISNPILKKIQYDFLIPDKKTISISIDDFIQIVEIDEKKALVCISRELSLDRTKEIYIKISYDVSIESDEDIEKDMLIKELQSKTISMTSVFSKISLLISQITSMSPFGIIVSPPNYNAEEVTIS